MTDGARFLKKNIYNNNGGPNVGLDQAQTSFDYIFYLKLRAIIACNNV